MYQEGDTGILTRAKGAPAGKLNCYYIMKTFLVISYMSGMESVVKFVYAIIYLH